MANGELNGDWKMVRNILVAFVSVVLAGYFTWSASCHIGQGDRLTKLETKWEFVASKLEKIDKIEALLEEVRHDQKRREKREK